MGTLIDLLDAGGADAESLIGLMARGAGAAISAKALKESIVFVNVAGRVEGSDRAGRISEPFEVWNDDYDRSRCAQRCERQENQGNGPSQDLFHTNLASKEIMQYVHTTVRGSR
jgi:hypothetical protein